MEPRITDADRPGRILIEEQRLREPFTLIPNTILRRTDLTPGAKLTYIVLLSYAWQQDHCFPGQSTLARDLGAGRRSVVRYLQELKAVGLLSVHRRGLGHTNVYTLNRWRDAGSAKVAHPEVPEDDYLEMPNWHTKKTQHTNTQHYQDSYSNVDDDESGDAPVVVTDDDGEAAQSAGRRRSHRPVAVAELLHHRGRLSRPRPNLPDAPIGRPSTRSGSKVSEITATMAAFSSEFGDAGHLRSNLAHVVRLRHESGLSASRFVSLLHEARALTRDVIVSARLANSVHRPSVRNRMAYFFACLRGLLAVHTEARPTPLSGDVDPA
jgi:hypothetical protein